MPEPVINPLVVLTRPQGRNDSLASLLRESGFETLELPALSICPLPIDTESFPLPSHYDLIVFVSASAVRFYLDQLAEQGRAEWPATTLAATVGEASARPLREAGFIPFECIVHPSPDTRQDSEALWRLLAQRQNMFKRVAIVRGENGREWLGECLERAGALVHRYAVYRRCPSIWTDDQRQTLAAALESGRILIGLFTSSESIEALHQNLMEAGLQVFWSCARFVVIHERIAVRLQFLIDTMPGKNSAAMVKICPPADKAIFQTVTSLASL